MLLYLSAAALALAGLYAVVTLVNLAIFRTPRILPQGQGGRISVLIPARDEAANISAALDGALGQEGVEIEVVVLDDGSTDGTDRIVSERADTDPRVRLIRGEPLPSGWNGKQHACYQLANAAVHPTLLFIDADVRLSRDAGARMLSYLKVHDLALVSGFPRQITGTLAEKIVIPQILVLLLGYLPFPMARLSNALGFAAGCGQLMMVAAETYQRSGGHAAFRTSMHDGLNLPRNIRKAGGRTDILDATPIAACRMYDNWADIWKGFSKNATEGMAKPVALPIWTVLLFGGHIMPILVALVAWLANAPAAAEIALLAVGLVFVARMLLALKVRQHPISVLLHPIGVAVTLWIQWSALIGAQQGRQAEWRGRTYDVN